MALPIGFFAPLPLPMMIPFMAMQSAMMAWAFGTNFQFGKRKISAMSNEEFNNLTQKQLLTDQVAFMGDIVDKMPELFKESRKMNAQVLDEFVNMIKDAVNFAGGIIGELITPPGTPPVIPPPIEGQPQLPIPKPIIENPFPDFDPIIEQPQPDKPPPEPEERDEPPPPELKPPGIPDAYITLMTDTSNDYYDAYDYYISLFITDENNPKYRWITVDYRHQQKATYLDLIQQYSVAIQDMINIYPGLSDYFADTR